MISLFNYQSIRAKALLFVLLSLICGGASAINVNNAERGSYAPGGTFGTGGSGTATGNYLTGGYSGDYRSFFNFDLSSVVGTVTAASFVVYLDDFGSNTGAVTLNLWDVSTLRATLSSGGAGVAGWTDLGSGTLLGSLAGLPTGNTTGTVAITLNDNGLLAINSALGGDFSLGGALDNPNLGWLFGSSIDNPPAELRLTVGAVVPEPETLVLFGIGLVGLRFSRRRKA